MSHIFISYSRQDEAFARRLSSSLSNLGAEVWLDLEDIPAGMKWSTAIQQGLDQSELMIVIVSPDSMASNNVEDEWQYYFDQRKPVIPILLRPAKIHFQLSRIQHIDFQSLQYEIAFERLQKEIERKGIKLGSTALYTPPDLLHILPPPFDWCEITAGRVMLEADGYVLEGGLVAPVEHFFIAKYPITNAQFQLFADAKDGYNRNEWWEFSTSAVNWRKKNRIFNSPALDSGLDHPSINVTWYEAVAFCRWLSRKAETEITLPTDAQWQRAAQGDDTRKYPWGNNFDSTRCNTSESGLKATTPVTQYTAGISPFGVMDMIGNVWEWCLTGWDDGTIDLATQQPRLVRGGAWNRDFKVANAVSRRNSNPFFKSVNHGLRVCINVT